ncbi:hypothetical protein MRX96_031814 [Rhipicephalus microplus]
MRLGPPFIAAECPLRSVRGGNGAEQRVCPYCRFRVAWPVAASAAVTSDARRKLRKGGERKEGQDVTAPWSSPACKCIGAAGARWPMAKSVTGDPLPVWTTASVAPPLCTPRPYLSLVTGGGDGARVAAAVQLLRANTRLL